MSKLIFLTGLLVMVGCGATLWREEVVITTEPRSPVKFENELASKYFNLAISDVQNVTKETKIGVPFLFSFYQKVEVLTPAAHFARQFRECDADIDGTVSVVEAEIYYQWHRRSLGKVKDATEIKKISAELNYGPYIPSQDENKMLDLESPNSPDRLLLESIGKG